MGLSAFKKVTEDFVSMNRISEETWIKTLRT
jgi:hypothetical protein